MLWVRILFAVLSTAVAVAVGIFGYRRLVRDTRPPGRLRYVFIGLLIALSLAAPLSRLTADMPRVIVLLLVGWGVFMYTVLALLVLEAGRRTAALVRPPTEPENPERRLLLSRAAALGAVTTGVGGASYGAWRAFTPPEVTEVPVRLRGLPKALDGFTIVQLSDVHVGAVIQERFLDQLVDTANRARPDLVAITGDLVDGSPSALGRYVARLRNLSSRFGTHFVSGNHDYYSDWEAWSPALTGMGFVVLRNRFVTIGDAGASSDLVGVDDWGGRWGRAGYDLDRATAGRDPSRASVLLAHQPHGLDLAAEKQLGLQLSGHTHGGQLFPGNLVADVIWGDRNTGLSQHQGTQLYTSRGCGFVGPPMRVGAPPEVVKLVLVAS